MLISDESGVAVSAYYGVIGVENVHITEDSRWVICYVPWPLMSQKAFFFSIIHVVAVVQWSFYELIHLRLALTNICVTETNGALLSQL